MEVVSIKQLVETWSTANATLKQWKDYESKLRASLVKSCFSNAKIGINSYKVLDDNNVPTGNTLKATIKYNYTIMKNEKVVPADYSNLPDILNKIPYETAIKLIKWKPELNEKEYKLLSEEEKQIVNEFLIIKEATPSLELK